MKKYLHLTYLLLLILITSLLSCERKDLNNRFPLADKFNINGEKLTQAFDKIKEVEGELSLIVCRDDTIVAEEFSYYNNYGPDSIKNIMSVTKTFTGVLIGLAIEEGYITSVNDPIGMYLTDVVNFPDDIKPAITIDQLLFMSFGHAWNGTETSSLIEECFFESDNNLQCIIDLPLVTTPGTVFNYSDGASHLLSVIITEATGENTLDFARNNLFDPMGITEYEWSTDDRGYPVGAAWLRIKPHDMVKFGNLILHKGYYNELQIVPEAWINEMTTTRISTNNDVPYGPQYGYQIWLGEAGGHSYYMAMGWGGQFIIIVPDQQLVVTATCWTSNLTDQQAGEHWMSIIQIIFEDILPAVN